MEEELIDKDDVWLFSILREKYRSLKGTSNNQLKKLLRMLLYREPLRMPKRRGEHEEYVEIERKQYTEKYYVLKNFKVLAKRYLEKKGIPEKAVFIDEPSLRIRETPYKKPREEEKEEIGIWILEPDGQIKEITERHGSLIKDIARRMLCIVRIYTMPDYRDHIDEILNELLSRSIG